MRERPLTPKQVAGLEAAFAAETEGRLPCQTIRKVTARQLMGLGLLEELERALPGTRGSAFALTVRGYVLTERGHFAYCSWAAENRAEGEGDG